MLPRVKFLALFLCCWLCSPVAFADDQHPDQGAALAHCADMSSAYAAVYAGGTGSAVPCVGPTITTCSIYGQSQSCGIYQCRIQKADGGYLNCNQTTYHTYHRYPASMQCDDVGSIGPLGISWGLDDMGDNYCMDGCNVEIMRACGGVGVQLCTFWGVFTGDTCTTDGQDDEGQVPEGCTNNGGELTCDCVTNPSSWFCQQYDENPVDNACTGSRCVDDDDASGGGNPQPGEDGEDDNGTGNSCSSGDADGDGVNDSSGIICDGDAGGGGGNPDPGNGTGIPGGALCNGPAPFCDKNTAECAMLIQAWQMEKEVYCDTEEGEPWDLDESIVDPFDSENQEEIDLSEEVFDLSGDGGGACPANPVLAIMGTNTEFDITPLCTYATTLKPLILLATLLASAFFVFRGS